MTVLTNPYTRRQINRSNLSSFQHRGACRIQDNTAKGEAMAPPNVYTFNVQDSKIIRLVREAPPAHYLLEIESFASLKNSVSQAYTTLFESTEFEAASHKWVLVIYPAGNKDDDGVDHISLYLKLIDKLDHWYFVVATVKFFIYDYRRKTYLIIQGLEEQRYDVMEKQKGIARALPLSDFMSSSNGFINGDRCKLGVEVLVADATSRTAFCSTLKERPNSIYTWPIENFSQIADKEHSDMKLELYPKGNARGYNKGISLYLFLVDFTDLINGKKLYVEHELRVRNLQNQKDATSIARGWYTNTNHNWGISNLLSLSDLHNSKKGFKIDDKMIVEVKLNLMVLMKDI
ncbi:MATH domain and coiled-coil domain-containing protein [Drosera capensis]